MSILKQRLFTNWHLMRIVKAGIGIMLLVTGIQNKDWVTGIFSIFFLYQAVMDVGCCGSQGCYTPPIENSIDIANTKQDEVIEYEEIK